MIVTLFLGATGVAIRAIDPSSIAPDRPATDPNVVATRQAFDGPDDFQVRQVGGGRRAPACDAAG